jgi:CheY-like chemotaxis protein
MDGIPALAAVPTLAKKRATKPLILCVEDDPIYITLRKKVLEREGYNVIGVSKASDALRILRESPVCAVIADHMLQGTTGMELAKHMKKIKPRIPVILFSGTAPQGLGGCLRQQGRTHRKVSSSVTLLSDFGRKLSV